MSKLEAWLRLCNRVVMGAWPRAARAGMRGAVLPLLLAALLAPPVQAQNAPRPEQLIKWRQSAYQAISWNAGRLKNALAPGGKYDATEVRTAANTLAALAASGLPSLFMAGTEKGRGWRETSAAAAAFEDAAKFRQLSEDFSRDAAQLAKLAAGTDVTATQEQFRKVAQACKSCHNQFRQTE
jgi:cytochrome c556